MALGYAVAFALVTALAMAWVYWSVSEQIQAQIDTGLTAEAEALRDVFEGRGLDNLESVVDTRSRAQGRIVERDDPSDPGRRYYRLEDAGGRLLAGSYPAWPAGAGTGGPVTIRRDEDVGVRAVTVGFGDGSRLMVGQALDEADELRAQILGYLLAAFGITILAGMAGGMLMGRRVQRRIDGIGNTAGEIMSGDLSRRVPEGRRDDEFAGLARRLNAMLARLESSLHGMREVTDNVAHDLRQPLNRLRSRLEVTLLNAREESEYRAAMEEAIADADDLLRTFNALLRLAQLEAGVHRGQFRTVDLSALLCDLVDLYQPLTEEAGLRLQADVEPGLGVRGDRELLGQACANLLDNAIKYVPSGGAIRVTLAGSEGAARLAVADTGPGIPARERERVTRRFVRLDVSRHMPGNGLGLSLVRAIAQLHGGRFTLEDNSPGLIAAIAGLALSD